MATKKNGSSTDLRGWLDEQYRKTPGLKRPWAMLRPSIIECGSAVHSPAPPEK